MKRAHSELLKHGFIAGILGYGTLSVYYAGYNLLFGRSPLHTVAALGGALFDPSNAVPNAGPIIAYNGVHLCFFLVIGVLAAWLLYEVELHPMAWLAAMLTLTMTFLIITGAAALLAAAYAGVSATVVVVGNLLAAAAIGVWLGTRHPGLEHKVEELWDPEFSLETAHH
jgi:hypothetical protein